jgi:hypothetical protein
MRRSSIAAAIAAAALSSGCGNKTPTITHGENEGAYVDVGHLKYQVQITRQLNPYSAEDKTYLSGLSLADRAIKTDEVWFAVFIRVQNDKKKTYRSATDFEIADTVDDVYRPLHLASNPFAYQAATMIPNSLIPAVDTAASDSNIQGSLLLFKMPRDSLENRPLELRIKAPVAGEPEGTVDLDV